MSVPELYIGPHRTEQDLENIISLQAENFENAVTPEEARKEGFVTIIYDVPTLRNICGPYRHIIAVDGEILAGYALVLLKSAVPDVPFVLPMVNMIKNLSFKGVDLEEENWFIMGQVCVAKPYRGKGVLQAMYDSMKNYYMNIFQYIITEIAGRNQRSLYAHQNVGFKILHSFHDDQGELWHIVILPVF
ncbi:MAG TPA: hypothetical protein PKC30_07265 [Saprospiraceae bacterium]|nr:hypothetical protein [Saprospiraceae bacterium]